MEVGGDDLPGMHHRFAETLDRAVDRIREIQDRARTGGGVGEQPRWPLIVLRSPKGWTGPAVVDGVQVVDSWRSHQVPLSGVKENPEHLRILRDWLLSYQPQELFDRDGAPVGLVRSANPVDDKAMTASPYTNGNADRHPMDYPDFRDYGVAVAAPATERMESPRVLGDLMRDLYTRNPDAFRVFCPDETNSTASVPCSRSATGPSWNVSSRGTRRSRRRAGSWRCSASTTATAGWRATP